MIRSCLLYIRTNLLKDIDMSVFQSRVFNVTFCFFALFFVCLSHQVMAQDEVVAEGESVEMPSQEFKEVEMLNSAIDEVIAEDASMDLEDDEDEFFDAESMVPQGSMARSSPVKVDPGIQPGSRYIIVRKNHDANTKEARLVSAERAMSIGRYDSAIPMFDELYQANSKDKRVLMGRAIVLQNLERFDEAMEMYDILSKLDEDNVGVKINMYGLLGTRFPALALRHLLDLHDNNRSNPDLAAQIAVIYGKTGDSVSALKYLGIASSINPNNASHVFNMAIISDRSGDSAKAVKYYEKALEIDTIYGAGRSIPRDSVYNRLAKIR